MRKEVEMSNIPKIDKAKFEDVVNRLLRQEPTKRSEIKTGGKKLGKVIPPKE
jgi:hypothetical protein